MEQQSQNMPTPEAFDQLHLLAQRLLAPRFGPIGVQPDVALLPGVLAPELVDTVPLPPGAHIIGTMHAIVNTTDSPFPRTTCIIDVPGERADVFAYFATALPQTGWQAEEMPQMQPREGGFSYGIPGLAQQVIYRQPPLGWLTIRAESDAAGGVGLRLELSPLSMIPQMRRAAHHANPLAMLPILPPLPGVTLLPRGASGGSNRQTSDAILMGTVTINAIQDFYVDRLKTAGWSLVDAAGETRTAWSTWTFTDEDQANWQGFLLIFQPDPERTAWNLRLEASLTNDAFAGQGSFSSMQLGPR